MSTTNDMLSPTPSARMNRRSSTTEIVHTLFGSSVGACQGDFSCSYRRQKGRLYASTHAISYYSNLFSFERRICLRLENVANIQSYRTTSVRITMLDGKHYIFKSFRDHDRVTELLQDLLEQATPVGRPRAVTEHSNDTDSSGRTPLKALRLRARSADHLESPLLATQLESTATMDGDDSSDHSSDNNNTLEAWEEVKNSTDPTYKEIALNGLKLPCTLDEFFALFLADSASHPMMSYMEREIGDSEMVVSPWTTGEDKDDSTLYRTLHFRHPIPSRMGPPSALAEKHQEFTRYGTYGFCVKTKTYTKGTVASDIFYLEDRWIIEPCGETDVTLTVQYEARFNKWTTMSRIIQKTTNKEVPAWYDGYSKMLLSSLKGNKSAVPQENGAPEKQVEQPTDPVGAPRVVVEKESSSSPMTMYVLVGCILFGVLLLLLQVGLLRQKLVSMESEFKILHDEHLQVLKQLQAALGELSNKQFLDRN